MNLVCCSSTGTLSLGMIGIPRHVMNWAPNRFTGGGTLRRVAPAEGCDAERVGEEEGGVFQTLVMSESRSSGVGPLPRTRMVCLG